MARPLRPEVDHGFWHAYNRGNERRNIVRSDRDRQKFVDLLAETVRLFGWRLHDFAMLSNHFHLNVEASTLVVAKAAGVDDEAIRHGRGGATRMLVAWLGWYEGMKRLRQIAAVLRLRSTGHISNLVRRCDRELRSDPILQRIADEALSVLRPPPVVRPF